MLMVLKFVFAFSFTKKGSVFWVYLRCFADKLCWIGVIFLLRRPLWLGAGFVL